MIREIWETFRKPSPQVVAQRELEECQRQLLAAQTGKEYAESMVSYREKQVRRLHAQVRMWAEESAVKDAAS